MVPHKMLGYSQILNIHKHVFLWAYEFQVLQNSWNSQQFSNHFIVNNLKNVQFL